VNAFTPPAVGLSAAARITITGQGLGAGNDITSVAVGSFAATIISQSTTNVIITLNGATPLGSHSISVTSLSRGTASCAPTLSVIQGAFGLVAGEPSFSCSGRRRGDLSGAQRGLHSGR
jgi:hypothetical protein